MTLVVVQLILKVKIYMFNLFQFIDNRITKSIIERGNNTAGEKIDSAMSKMSEAKTSSKIYLLN